MTTTARRRHRPFDELAAALRGDLITPADPGTTRRAPSTTA